MPAFHEQDGVSETQEGTDGSPSSSSAPPWREVQSDHAGRRFGWVLEQPELAEPEQPVAAQPDHGHELVKTETGIRQGPRRRRGLSSF